MEVQLWVKNENGIYEQLDLFTDENISLTQKLKDSTEVGKAYSTFSKTFKIPSSPVNDRVLRYFAETDLERTSEPMIESKLYINQTLFKKGYIVIEDAKLSFNRTEQYGITFYTNLTNLKDLVGEQMLSDTLRTKKYEVDLQEANIWFYALGRNPNSTSLDKDVIVPFVSTKRDIIDNNILRATELRPAILIKRILDDVGLVIGKTFDTSALPLTDLYTWCNGNQYNNYVNNVVQDELLKKVKIRNGWEFPQLGLSASGGFGPNDDVVVRYDRNEVPYLYVRLNLQPYTDAIFVDKTQLSYIVSYKDNLGNWVRLPQKGILSNINNSHFKGSAVGIKVVDFPQLASASGLTIKVEVEGLHPLSVFRDNNDSFKNGLWISTTTTENFPTIFAYPMNETVNIVDLYKLLPNMKTIDFINSIAKMFNCSFTEPEDEVINPNTIVLKPLSAFYQEKVDLNDYINIEDIQLKRIPLYKKISFKHKDSDLAYNKYYYDDTNKRFGALEYQSPYDSKLSTDELTVESKFTVPVVGKIEAGNLFYSSFIPAKFEDLSYTGNDTSGVWNINKLNADDFIIFYYKGQKILTNTSLQFAFFNPAGGGTDLFYNQATVNEISWIKGVNSLCFDEEENIETGVFDEVNLYKKYYSAEVDRVYNRNTRLYECEAYLPLNKLRELNLYNSITIGRQNFSIDELTTDLISGKSKLVIRNFPTKVFTPTYPPNAPTTFTGTIIN